MPIIQARAHTPQRLPGNLLLLRFDSFTAYLLDPVVGPEASAGIVVWSNGTGLTQTLVRLFSSADSTSHGMTTL